LYHSINNYKRVNLSLYQANIRVIIQVSANLFDIMKLITLL